MRQANKTIEFNAIYTTAEFLAIIEFNKINLNYKTEAEKIKKIEYFNKLFCKFWQLKGEKVEINKIVKAKVKKIIYYNYNYCNFLFFGNQDEKKQLAEKMKNIKEIKADYLIKQEIKEFLNKNNFEVLGVVKIK